MTVMELTPKHQMDRLRRVRMAQYQMARLRKVQMVTLGAAQNPAGPTKNQIMKRMNLTYQSRRSSILLAPNPLMCPLVGLPFLAKYQRRIQRLGRRSDHL